MSVRANVFSILLRRRALGVVLVFAGCACGGGGGTGERAAIPPADPTTSATASPVPTSPSTTTTTTTLETSTTTSTAPPPASAKQGPARPLFMADEMNGIQAFMTGKVRISGDVMYAQRMEGFFRD